MCLNRRNAADLSLLRGPYHRISFTKTFGERALPAGMCVCSMCERVISLEDWAGGICPGGLAGERESPAEGGPA